MSGALPPPAPPNNNGAGEMTAVRLLPARLSFFYIALFLFVGINMPFWPLWLTAHGLDAGEIGAVLAAGLWIKVAANPVLARFADRRGETRLPLVLMLLVATASYGAFAFVDGFWPILGVTLVAASAMSAVMPLGDSLTMHAAMTGRVQYGRIRLWGSVAFILAASGGGMALAGRSSDLVLDSLIVALGLTFVAAMLLPEWRRPPAAAGSRGVIALVSDRRFVLFLLAASLIQASHSVLYGFGTLHWQAAGHGPGAIGWLWAEGVIVEVLLFAMGSALLRRIDGPRLLLLSGVAGMVRWIAFGFSTAFPVLAAGQILHAVTFGAAHLAAMDFIARAAPPGLAATAQGLYSAVALGAVFGITMAFSGRLYADYAGGAFLAMAAMAAAGTAVAALVVRWSRGGPDVPPYAAKASP
jgi:PPP family 3-phenylpropionic acid transporter